MGVDAPRGSPGASFSRGYDRGEGIVVMHRHSPPVVYSLHMRHALPLAVLLAVAAAAALMLALGRESVNGLARPHQRTGAEAAADGEHGNPRLPGGSSAALPSVRPASRRTQFLGHDGAPLAFTRLKIQDVSDRYPRVLASGVTDEAGFVNFGRALDQALATSRIEIEVNSHGRAPQLVRIPVEQSALASGQVILDSGWVVYGRVSDLEGAPVCGARVWCRDAGESDGNWTGMKSGVDGTFSLRRLARASVEIRAGIPGHQTPIHVVAPDSGPVDLVIDVASKLTITISGWDSKQHGDRAALWIANGSGAPHELKLEQGTAQFLGLDPAKMYVFSVQGGDGDEVVYAGPMSGSAGQYTVSPTRGGTIAGVVRAPAGAARVGVGVTGVAFVKPGVVDGDGNFEIRGVPPGVWTLSASAWIGERRLDVHVRAEPHDWIEVTIADPR